MKYQALYRKYRPKTFDEISGQKFIIKTLKNIIKNNKISHSYLFIGPRGTGKTSTAKIFAKTINCDNTLEGVSCEKCSSCELSNKNENIDIIEMDAASNNGVDEIREIKQHITLMPTNSKYKIYIIDEVHMLSTGAFNALLKTLEEPPKHIIFILATTDPQKVPLTIKSRCQNFEFKLLSDSEISSRLKYICEQEKINIEESALKLLSVLSKGGLRDAISMLDQLNSYTNGNIKKDDVVELSGTISEDDVKIMLDYIYNDEYKKCFEFIDELEQQGKKFNNICEKIIEYLKNIIIVDKEEIDKKIDLIVNFNDCINYMKQTNDKRICFDLYILKAFNIIKKHTNVRISDLSIKEIKPIQKKELKDEKFESNNMEDQPKKIETKIKSYDDYDELMLIRTNNILMKSTKESLKKYKEIYINKEENIESLDDLKLINLLLESDIKAASDDGLLITVNNKNILNEIYENLFAMEKLFNKLYNKNIKICFLLDDFWLNKRQSYIDLIKSKQIKEEDEKEIYTKIKKELKKIKSEFDELLEIGE